MNLNKGDASMQKLNKQQGEIVEKVLQRYNGDKARAAINYVPSKVFPHETFVRCMVEGWEVSLTKEEQIMEVYSQYIGKQGPARLAIRRVLRILDIYIEGVSNDVTDED
jgi:hypothetical protein